MILKTVLPNLFQDLDKITRGLPGVWGECENTVNVTVGTQEQSKKLLGNKGT